ncbi:MAG: hypothetical protein JRC91_13550 [Deltaproteobacteria bacterium]|nr:hypothetical protein [Deltaproteobacteria bacterium]
MNKQIKNIKSKKTILKNGKLFFTKETERKFFFFMTIIMLVMGIVVKLV